MWRDKSGQKQERTEWHRVIAFNNLAEIMTQYLKRGSKVFVSGELRTRKWQDKTGSDHYTTEIVADNLIMLDSLGDTRIEKPQSSGQPEQQAHYQGGAEFDDDIPF